MSSSAKRRFFGVVVLFAILVDLSVADPETVDGLLKKRSEPPPPEMKLQQGSRVLSAPSPVAPGLLYPHAPAPARQRVHFGGGGGFRQDSLGRNLHPGYPSRNGKAIYLGIIFLHIARVLNLLLLAYPQINIKPRRVPPN
jgi:hypothetical protein